MEVVVGFNIKKYFCQSHNQIFIDGDKSYF